MTSDLGQANHSAHYRYASAGLPVRDLLPVTMEAELAARQFSAHAILNELHVPVTAIGDAISQLHTQIRQADEDAQRERQHHGASDPSAASPDDTLLLNVGGHLMSVRWQHMTQGEGVEGTLLAALFGGCWEGRLIKDDSQRVFVDICPEAFKAVHKAILNAETLRSAGKAASVGHLLNEVAKRDKGRHGFWVKLLTTPLDKDVTEGTGSADSVPTGSLTSSPTEAAAALKAMEAILKAFANEKARLEGQLRAANTRRDNLDKEIKAVEPFLLPLSGGDAIRSVEVCGQLISTTQSTVDEMGDIALSHRFDLWSSSRAVEVVDPDHIGRMVDFYRRKRLGASPADMAAVLTMAGETDQAPFDVNAAMYGIVKTDTPTLQASVGRRTGTLPSSGYPYEVVQEGTGRVPTINDRVKFDRAEWRDAFDGQNKAYDYRGAVYRVSDLYGWLRELFLSMREGEVRHIKVPDGPEPYRELRLISIE
ncbi:unnamed protein product [Vitrella brassicaformis CCMP3155]|uniref:Potassium channel tetramerisation-type BTB domain-containing protein n=1 Tax=Vitrella brassicaformis (strain CCMP3155) TaxID=1169540 RepID=A0A0G4H4T0_VITBC|nr:unnamed protein product [Vitrella brassicaformis CCMP3155]|eukprot:CEM38800.1 unnamed protein product [Vitrella brassicaformis CCMP3155]